MKVQTTTTGESSDSRFWDAMETIGSAEMMRAAAVLGACAAFWVWVVWMVFRSS